jgi:hypothetical protein
LNDYPEPKKGGLKRGLMITLLAFVAGLGAMGWAITSWQPARELVMGPEQVEPEMRTVPAPVAPLPPRVAPAPGDDRIAELEARIDRLQSLGGGGGGASDRAEGLLIAFAARRAIDRGLALGYLEGALQQHFGGSQPRAVGMVISAARDPVTIDTLKDQLIALGPKLVSGSNETGLWTRIQDNLSSLIIVRRAGMPSSNPVQRLARAQAMVDAGRIDVALVEIARLPGAPAATGWMRDARRLAEAHKALDLLEASAIMQPGSATPKTLPPAAPKAKEVPPAPPTLKVPEDESI